MKAKAKVRWGWIVFGAGLAACVIAGGVLGIVLGQQDDEERSEETRRVAALALDASALSGDALALSRSIEEAISREELESEAESLRERLALIDGQAESIRFRVEGERDSLRSSTFASRSDARRARRALQGIGSSLAVFREEVVAGLDSTLDSSPSPGSTAGEKLADLTLVLEEQDQALNALAEELRRSDESDEPTFAGSDGEDAADEFVAGSFETTLLTTGQMVPIEYELADLRAAVDTSDADPDQAEIVSTASGDLALTDAGEPRQGVEPPKVHMVLFWRYVDVPAGAFEGLVSAPSSSARNGYGSGDSAPVEGEPCRYEIEGEHLCALARFAFEEEAFEEERNADGAMNPRPDEGSAFAATESDEALAVAKDAADAVAELIESTPPDIVQVIADDSGEDFAPACVEPTAELLSGPVTLGLLSGDGTVIFESADTDPTAHIGESGYGTPPECYALVSGPE